MGHTPPKRQFGVFEGSPSHGGTRGGWGGPRVSHGPTVPRGPTASTGLGGVPGCPGVPGSHGGWEGLRGSQSGQGCPGSPVSSGGGGGRGARRSSCPMACIVLGTSRAVWEPHGARGGRGGGLGGLKLPVFRGSGGVGVSGCPWVPTRPGCAQVLWVAQGVWGHRVIAGGRGGDGTGCPRDPLYTGTQGSHGGCGSPRSQRPQAWPRDAGGPEGGTGVGGGGRGNTAAASPPPRGAG